MAGSPTRQASPSVERMWALEPATYRPAAGDADAPRIPFPIYLIEHATGLVLVDAGLDPDHVGDPVGAYGELAERIDIRFDERHLIETHLEALGYSLTDVSTVVATHLHFDHAGALKRFQHARIVLGAGELEYARAPERFASGWYRSEDFDERHRLEFDAIERDTDLVGDGSITAVRLPGHSPGSLGVLVRLPHQRILLSGDAVHTRHALDNEIHYHGDVDSLRARASLRKLGALCAEHQARVWIAHDPDDWNEFGGHGEVRRPEQMRRRRTRG